MVRTHDHDDRWVDTRQECLLVKPEHPKTLLPMKPRYLKVVRDLTSDYQKNVMLVIAVSLGIFAVGTILATYAVVSREMKSNYVGTNPASATLEVGGNISKELLDSVRALPGIKQAERHATVSARMRVGERWFPLLLFVIDDFGNKNLNKIAWVSGDRVPPDGAMLVERTALRVMHADQGDEIEVKTSHGTMRSVRITGIVHDAGLAPAWQEQAGYGYITLSTLRWLGATQGFDQLRITTTGNPESRSEITATANATAIWLKGKHRIVHEIQIPPPGKHPHQGQMKTILSIFILFTYFILVLACVLVATAMSTLMVKHTRQIGVMKAIGAGTAQVFSLYFLMIMVVSVVALIAAIPLSRLAAAALSSQLAALLNLEINKTAIPFWVVLVQVSSGFLLPLAAGALPVARAARISVRRALDNHGVQQDPRGNKLLARISTLDLLSDSLRLSLRQVLRLKVKLLTTVGLLAAAGAMFMMAMNVSAAWDKMLSRIYVQRRYDLEVRMTRPANADSLVAQIRGIHGVKNCEAWNFASASALSGQLPAITSTYPDKGHGSFSILALPVPTQLLNPTVVEGSWLHVSANNDVVLNQSARAVLPAVKIGDTIRLSMDTDSVSLRVIGFTDDVGSPAIAYVGNEFYGHQTRSTGTTRMVRIAYTNRSGPFATARNQDVEELLHHANIDTSSSTPVGLLRNAVAGHMKVLINTLLAMAFLMAIVGGMGLISAISMSVMERTREIGVMRAIGATPRRIRNLITMEGMIISVSSVVLGFLLSLPLSYSLGRFIGQISFRIPLSLTISVTALIAWFVIAVAGSYVAALFPAHRAVKITTRDALAYE
jgi:putative ABC transport system permease protein